MSVYSIENTLLDKVVRDLPAPMTEVIEPFDQRVFELERKFCIEERWSDNATVNVFKVEGMRLSDYIGLSWLEFLQDGGRMDLNLRLFAENPVYYQEKRKKEPTMHYIRWNNRLYVYGDGNHRTCIARAYLHFLGIRELHGIDLTEYQVNYRALKTYENLVKGIEEKRLHHVEVKPVRKLVAREDGPGWHNEKFKLGLEIRNRRLGRIFTVDVARAEALTKDLGNMGWLGKFFGKMPEIFR